MANTITGSVIRCDTTAAFPVGINITGFKIQGSGSVVVRKQNASGGILYENVATGEEQAEEVYIRSSLGIHVTISPGAVLFIFLK